MFVKTHWLRLGPAIFLALAIVAIVLVICYGNIPTPELINEAPLDKEALYSCVCSRANFVVERGVIALRGRVPGRFIRGMLDTVNADLTLVDFEKAALVLAPKKNPGAEFILGWLCANGSWHAPNTAEIEDLFSQQIDLRKLGLTLNQRLAAQWYALASMHGSSAASVALGQMLDYSYGEDHEKSFALAAKFYQRGIAQGDDEARIHLACSYAYGRGVKRDAARAWRELEDVIKHSDTENSTYAIVLAMEAWKDGKITPPTQFSHGATSAYEFVRERRYVSAMAGSTLDEICSNPGCVPDPYPQFRGDLATEIRKDWARNDR